MKHIIKEVGRRIVNEQDFVGMRNVAKDYDDYDNAKKYDMDDYYNRNGEGDRIKLPKEEHEYKLDLINAGAAGNREQLSSDRQDAAIIGTGAVLGLVGAVGAYKLIKMVYDHYKWKHDGCNQIQNPHKKLDCEAYVKNNVVKALSQQLSKCQDEKCRETIKSEITKHMSNQNA